MYFKFIGINRIPTARILRKTRTRYKVFDKNNDDFEHIISLWRPKDEKQGEQITGTWLHI